MRIDRVLSITTLLVVALTMINPAYAQRGGGGRGGGGGGSGDSDKGKDKDKPYVSPTPAALPPHLERGALVCSSREDLMHYQAALVDRTAATGSAPDCHTITDRIFVNVLGRDGPSRTQVSVTGQTGDIAWTNAYLPAN